MPDKKSLKQKILDSKVGKGVQNVLLKLDAPHNVSEQDPSIKSKKKRLSGKDNPKRKVYKKGGKIRNMFTEQYD